MWKKFLTSAKGFGLVEIMVAAAMAGGLALVVAKINQDMTRTTRSAETNSEINQFMADVSYILSDRDNCNVTVPNGTTSGDPLTTIQRLSDTGTPQAVYQTSPDDTPIRYGNNSFSLKSMTVEKLASGTWELIMTIRREGTTSFGVRELTKTIPIEVVEDGSGNVDQCFTNVDTIITSAVKQACGLNAGGTYIADAGATESTTYYDPVLKACISALEPRLCSPGQVLVEAKVEGNNEVRFTCEDVIRNPITCTTEGHYVKGINAAGEVDCQPLATSNRCAVGQYAITVLGGAVVCEDIPHCGPKQIMTSNPFSGQLQCKDVPCDPTYQYMAGIDNSGQVICKTFPNSACGAGQYIKEIRNDGTVICDFVPLQENISKVDFSFVDGYNRATNTLSRKTIGQTAQQICGYFNGFTWSGSKCLQPTINTRNLYSDKDGILRLSGGSDSTTVGCSNCGSGCTPPGCPAGYANHGHSCSMGGNCGWHRWRNCNRTCVRTRPVEGKIISP